MGVRFDRLRQSWVWAAARFVLGGVGLISLWTGLTVPEQAAEVSDFLGFVGADGARVILTVAGFALLGLVLWTRPPVRETFNPENWVATLGGRLVRKDTLATDSEGVEMEGAVQGWDSKVVGITRTSGDPRLVALFFKLKPPDGKQADEVVSAEVTLPDGRTLPPVQSRWEDFHLELVDAPHYSMMFPLEFGGEKNAPLDNGRYVLRWQQRYGLGSRYVTEPHEFEIRDGELVTDGLDDA